MVATDRQQVAEAYLQALFDTDRDRAMALIAQALETGMTPEEVIFSVVIPGIEFMIGGLASDSLITLSQHFLASEIAEEVTDMLMPRFAAAPEIQGRVVIGTSFGDFHGLGKKIVTGCLKASMFAVTDLGLNVAPELFVERALAEEADVIGVSAMMVHSATGERGARMVRKLLRKQGLEGRIKLIVGGAPYRFHRNLYLEVGADAWADTGAAAPGIIAGLVREVRP